MPRDKIIVTSHPRCSTELLSPVRVPGYRGEPVERKYRMLALLDDPWTNRNLCWDTTVLNGSYCMEPRMRCLQVKVGFDPHSLDLLPSYGGLTMSYSLWVDPGVEFREDLDLDGMASAYLQGRDFCAFRHPIHDCAYEYAEELRAKFPLHAPVISEQVDRYLRDGFPRKRGLLDTSVLLRRHTPSPDDRVKEICALWWREILLGYPDETLSLVYAMWKLGDAHASTFPGLMGEDFTPVTVAPPRRLPPCNPYFRRRP